MDLAIRWGYGWSMGPFETWQAAGWKQVAQWIADELGATLVTVWHEQWRGFEKDGQWRFTPPVQVVAALVEALRRLEAEGGPAARLARYNDNFRTLLAGMRRLGFELYLDEAAQSPIIATFRMPEERAFGFKPFYDALAAKGFLIYPGKLTQAETFRVGCIGALDRHDFERLLAAVADVLETLEPGRARAAYPARPD